MQTSRFILLARVCHSLHGPHAKTRTHRADRTCKVHMPNARHDINCLFYKMHAQLSRDAKHVKGLKLST